MGVGMPAQLHLQEFGEHIFRAFGHIAYHVGSSLREKSGWRDVDVRLMLPDEEYARLGLGEPDRPQWNPRWVSICLAWAAFGKALTGLPIDFQIQQVTHANAKERGPRSGLFSIAETVIRQRVAEDAIARFREEFTCPECSGALFQPNDHCTNRAQHATSA